MGILIVRRALVAAGLSLALVTASCSNGVDDLGPALDGTGAASTDGNAEPVDNAADEAEVRAAFEAYRKALQARDGAAAAELVSADTITYYDELVPLISTAGPEEIKARSIVERFTVAMMRHVYPDTDVASMDGTELLVFSVNEGLVGDAALAEQELGELTVNGDGATAQVVIRGKATPGTFTFARTDGEWKLDLTPLLVAARTGFTQAAKQAGVTEDEYIFQVIEATSGRKVDESIFARP